MPISRILPASLLRISASLLLLAASGLYPSPILGADDPATDTLPSLEEALAAEVHGRIKLRKKVVDLAYDFKKEEQGQDFVEASGVIRIGGGMVINFGKGGEEKPISLSEGRLPLKGQTTVRYRAPLEAIGSVTLLVTALESFHISLRGKGKPLNFWLGETTGAGLGDDGLRNLWSSQKSIFLQPDKRHKIEIRIKRSSAECRLDGRKILAAKLPKDYVAPNELTIASDSEKKGYCLGFVVNGQVAASTVEIAGNRGRGEAGKGPLFAAGHVAKGGNFRVTSQEGEEHALGWLEKCETIADRIFDDFPPKTAPDKAVRDIYVFRSREVYEAYCGKQRDGRLSSGALAILHQSQEQLAEEEEDDTVIDIDIFRILEERKEGLQAVASGLLRQVHAPAPYWWMTGCTYYYSAVIDEGEGVSTGGNRSDLARDAREYIDKRETPRLSRLLEDPSVKNSRSRGIAWAWVHFLMKGDDGKHRPHLLKFHEALNAGKSGAEAGQAAFPTEVFNELYPAFMDHLQKL